MDTITLGESLRIFNLKSLKGHTEKSLRDIYHKLALKCHPDKGGSGKDFIRLRQAYTLLKKVVNDPEFYRQKSGDGFQESYRKSSYGQSSSVHDNHNYDDIFSKEQILQELQRYKQAYQKAVETVVRYEKVFNSQIRIVNNTQNKLKILIGEYDRRRNEAEEELNFQLEELKKLHYRKWWQNLFPVRKISREEFIYRNNTIVQDFNKYSRQIDDEFSQKVVKLYQNSFSEIVDLFDF
jgi:curved DNA-binding protein CbpA